jgi:pimeloyl-ACP methyl ester carboxylesterase
MRPGRPLAHVAGVGLALVVALAGCGADEQERAAADVPGLECRGEGRPTVVFLSGLGVSSGPTWAGVEPAVSRVTRTCLHDRPGTGGVPPATPPRDSAAMVSELRAALRDAGEKGPFVLVGASLGGLNAQLFAARHRQDVAGLVFVDAIHPDFDRRFAEVMGRYAARARMSSLESNPERVRFRDLQASDREVKAAGRLPAVPTVVLVHGRSFDPGGEPVPKLERAWSALARELAGPGGTVRVVPGTSHRIAEDDPAAVFGAIREVLRQAGRD